MAELSLHEINRAPSDADVAEIGEGRWAGAMIKIPRVIVERV
jgi:hypothetical protein